MRVAGGNERSLVWREIEAAFESRIATGAVINYNHIEPRRFLEDASDIVLERVRDAVERQGSVKVNTAFNGEFATKDKRANKSIITKNSEIYRCTDMREWDKHVNMLYLQDPRNDGVGHFAWIKDLSRLVSMQLTRKEHKKYFCDRVGYYVRCSYDDALSKYRFRRGKDCVAWFTEELKSLAHRVKDVISANVPMEALSKQQWEVYRTATRCHICEKPCGPAHTNCNLNYKNSMYIPVVFHNLSGYDAHFIIKEIATAYDGHVELLPITKEKYISFTKHVDSTKDNNTNNFQRNCVKLRFIDSFKFLSTSLEKLASYLDKNKLKIVRSEFTTLSDEEFELLTRKGVFPYEYVDCVDKLNERCLPPRESFYSSLTGDTVSESDYAHAVNVWQRFSIRTLGEYSDLYLKTDVLLLADIFENFRNSCVASYGLDPAHYYTLPGFTWDAMLKHTRVRFELLTDIDMVMFIERGIRDGLSQCSGRYAQVNNKYMRLYDPSKPSSYLMYYDVNNLYGWAMCQPLPYAEFRWIEDAANFDASAIAPDSPTGYILEVDLDEKNLYKLMNNAVFGKTMENVRNHVDVKLVTKWDGRYGAEAMIAKPNFHSRSVFAENLIAVELRKLEVKFNKPIYVGMCILDISKVCLYEFHHEYMSPMYRDKCKIMYTDTDSLIYRIECDDAYETMKRDIARFDTSDYPADNAYGMPLANKKVPGLMKDENNCMIMTEFVGLRAKMYAVRVDGKKDTKKAKGVKSNVVA
ncbi:hypothetical protein ALC57_00581 [Trachymyrmex cornetzi]|uniref:DNA-directed DNA polymerase n=1 Tax=Trachymyrmex cornetzi TaxID=471704 RepID=A0A151JRV8_9HYME|nr:hypothetical protein ALC57_00581 [Trachymyrmex cornetzi]